MDLGFFYDLVDKEVDRFYDSLYRTKDGGYLPYALGKFDNRNAFGPIN